MKKRIISLILMFSIILGLVPIKSFATQPLLNLIAEPNIEKGYVELNWSDLGKGHLYMIFQKHEGDDEFRTIPAKEHVKVLNIYPDINNDLISGKVQILDYQVGK